jgi:hypothetical protein
VRDNPQSRSLGLGIRAHGSPWWCAGIWGLFVATGLYDLFRQGLLDISQSETNKPPEL